MPTASVVSSAGQPARQAATSPTSAALWRSALLIGCASASAMTGLLGQPGSFMQADPALGWLLRGMALLKAGMVLTAIALLFWRFGRPVPRHIAVVYVLGTAALAGASMLIWRLSYLPLAALVFHLAGFAVLLAAWRDGAALPAFLRRARWLRRPGRPATAVPASTAATHGPGRSR